MRSLHAKVPAVPPPGGPLKTRFCRLVVATCVLFCAPICAQSPPQTWAPQYAWSGYYFECPSRYKKAEIERAAINGDTSAQLAFGAAQARSCLEWKNPVEAVEFLHLAAAKGSVPALLVLGEVFRDGKDVPRDVAQAARWFARAAEQGDPRAMNDLGVCYAIGTGGTPDGSRAVQLFLQAAEKGLAEAEYNAAAGFDTGLGVAQNRATARQWYSKAAGQKFPDAAYRLGLLNEQGLGGPQDATAAAAWFAKAADFGSDDAQVRLGRKAPWQSTSVNSGYFQYAAAMNLLSGRGQKNGEKTDDKQDDLKVIALLQKSVERGYPPAMVQLGVMSQFGQGMPADEFKAQSYFRQSIARDPKYYVAFNNLAWLYVTSKNPKLHNAKKSLELAGKAVELSDNKDGASLDTLAHAYYELGNLDLALQNEKLAAQLAPSDNFIQKTLAEYQAAKEKQAIPPNSKF